MMTDHYFSDNPKSQFRRESFDVEVAGQKIAIHSGSGIFSMKELDFGSKLLIENAQLPKNARSLLDLGCGYGIIGITLKKLYPGIDVCMVDINERAVRMAKENCEINSVDIEVVKSDVLSHPKVHDRMFDTIVTNPPFSAGRKVCVEFIRQGFSHLNAGGIFLLVAPHNKGGESLKRIMLSVFNNVGEIAKKSGYRVYISMKNAKQ